MAENKVEISIAEEVKNTAKAMQRVTSAIFAGQPGIAARVKAKRKTAQFTFKMRSAADKTSLESKARRQILAGIFKDKAPLIEQQIKRALEAVIMGLVGHGNPNVSAMGISLGQARPRRSIDNAPWIGFIKSKEGAGEIGLPDPDESIRNLKIALVASVDVDVVVRADGPQVRFSFNKQRLLKLTPHPARIEGGAPAPFFSWLSLVTGPDFASGGTPGYGLVRIKDLATSLTTSKSFARGGLRKQRRVEITEGLIRASRTRSNAGALAGLMMSTVIKQGNRSPAEAFGGTGQDYRPNPRFNGFWDEWWMDVKLELGTWTRRIMRTVARKLLRG
jgi:hypothetical protein